MDIHKIKVGTLAPFLFPFDKSIKTAKRIEEIGCKFSIFLCKIVGLRDLSFNPSIPSC